MSTNPSYIPYAELSVDDKWKIANEGIPEKLQAIKDGKGIDFLYLTGSPSILQAITNHGYQPDEKIIDAYSKRTGLMKQADGVYEQLRHHELWLAGDPSGKRLEITDELQGCDLDGMYFNLSHAKFHGNTRVVNFGDTLLYGASFDGDVRGSIFKNGDLTQADLTKAKTDWIIVNAFMLKVFLLTEKTIALLKMFIRQMITSAILRPSLHVALLSKRLVRCPKWHLLL